MIDLEHFELGDVRNETNLDNNKRIIIGKNRNVKNQQKISVIFTNDHKGELG